MKRFLKRFKRNEKAQGLVEYGLILALVSVVAIGGLMILGDGISTKFENIEKTMRGEVIPPPLDDKNYTWVLANYFEQDDSYTATKEEGIGYYKYIGTSKEVNIPHTINGHPMTNYHMMFSGTLVESVTSTNPNVTNMIDMFEDSHVTTLDLSSFNTSNVTRMSGMFSGAHATTLDLSSFNTSKVTAMGAMFAGAHLTTLDLSTFDTSEVTTMYRMFEDLKTTTLDVSKFNTSKVTNMEQMFNGIGATTLDLSNFDTSNVTSMKLMFNTSKVTSLDLSSFNTSNVIDMSRMFSDLNITTLDLSSFDTSRASKMGGMFNNTTATQGFARTKADADKMNASGQKPSKLIFTVK